MNVILISSGQRPQLLWQSIRSLGDNASRWEDHTLTIVYDGIDPVIQLTQTPLPGVTIIQNALPQGASASRNIGASSIPKYRRQSHVMFLDDDVYMVKGWDEKLTELAHVQSDSILSAYGHPFNHGEKMKAHHTSDRYVHFTEPLVISSVCMLMRWELWDDVGCWTEPGGAGGSEDYDYCMRAKAKGYGFAVTEPQTVIHCGLTSSTGKSIVGYDESVKQNEALIASLGLAGKVHYE